MSKPLAKTASKSSDKDVSAVPNLKRKDGNDPDDEDRREVVMNSTQCLIQAHLFGIH